MRHLTGLPDEPDLYVARAAPEVLLIVRLPNDGPIEIVELVRPATLKMFTISEVTVVPA
jgi:hypothetical protein